MRFSAEQKEAITMYLLEQIDRGSGNIAGTVSAQFGISPNTVFKYITDLVSQGVVEKVGRGKYKLVQKQEVHLIAREEMCREEIIQRHYLDEYIKPLSGNIRDIWGYAFSEMMNNVIEHSEATKAYIIVRQDFLKTVVAIMDNGVGIFDKIKVHFDLDSLDDAVAELFKGKVTTDSANHSGEGIFFSSKMMDDFFVVSSKKVFSDNRFGKTSYKDFSAFNGRMFEHGTAVVMALSNSSAKVSSEIFNQYTSDSGDFDRTALPLQNMFDSYPVSRSQAKRVCSGLDRFKYIQFDFSGLEWVGHSFIHQIFVVYQREHPDIRISAINVNDDVKKVFRHVLGDNTVR